MSPFRSKELPCYVKDGMEFITFAISYVQYTNDTGKVGPRTVHHISTCLSLSLSIALILTLTQHNQTSSIIQCRPAATSSSGAVVVKLVSIPFSPGFSWQSLPTDYWDSGACVLEADCIRNMFANLMSSLGVQIFFAFFSHSMLPTITPFASSFPCVFQGGGGVMLQIFFAIFFLNASPTEAYIQTHTETLCEWNLCVDGPPGETSSPGEINNKNQ